MDQLEVFREQLRRKPGEMQKKELKKKKDGSDATVKVPAAWNITSTTSIPKPVKGLGLSKNKKYKSLYCQNLAYPKLQDVLSCHERDCRHRILFLWSYICLFVYRKAIKIFF